MTNKKMTKDKTSVQRKLKKRMTKTQIREEVAENSRKAWRTHKLNTEQQNYKETELFCVSFIPTVLVVST